MYRNYLKPILDLTISFLALVVLSPVFLLVVLALLIDQKGSIFFVQRRPGLYSNIFSIVKFKTMRDKRDSEGNLLHDKDRLTSIGKIVRKLSLDEIPQLFNVLKGEMSLVGPRPLLVEYLEKYSPEQARRHEVKPGITGWAQVNGRNAISWEEKFKLDVWYVENQSFWLDLKILWMTVAKVFKAEGISAQNHATVEKFEGSR